MLTPRYMQRCEGLRTDVTTINLSLMTYRWFAEKHKLYPGIVFPGTFHGAPGGSSVTKEGAFTLLQFLQANGKKYKIFLGGKLNFPDPKMDQLYENVPIGMVCFRSHSTVACLCPLRICRDHFLF